MAVSDEETAASYLSKVLFELYPNLIPKVLKNLKKSIPFLNLETEVSFLCCGTASSCTWAASNTNSEPSIQIWITNRKVENIIYFKMKTMSRTLDGWKKCLLHVHINSQGKKYLLCRDNVFGTTLFLDLCKQHKPFERARGKPAVLNK